MTPFEQMWESSRHNVWSNYVPWILNLGTLALLLLAFIPIGWLRVVGYVVVAFAMAWYATEYASLEIEEKWRIRYAYTAQHYDNLTEDEQFAATVDGANRVVGPLIFGAFAALIRCGWFLALIAFSKYCYRKLVRSPSNDSSDSVSTATTLKTN